MGETEINALEAVEGLRHRRHGGYEKQDNDKAYTYEDVATHRPFEIVLSHPAYGLSKNNYTKACELKADGNDNQCQGAEAMDARYKPG
ncbi:MAG: hypothetical protein DCF18_04925 [Cyanobium sp.]|nr:MAG: hypothetical protein DCF18_04925 [Cyanobium sp.]